MNNVLSAVLKLTGVSFEEGMRQLLVIFPGLEVYFLVEGKLPKSGEEAVTFFVHSQQRDELIPDAHLFDAHLNHTCSQVMFVQPELKFGWKDGDFLIEFVANRYWESAQAIVKEAASAGWRIEYLVVHPATVSTAKVLQLLQDDENELLC